MWGNPSPPFSSRSPPCCSPGIPLVIWQKRTNSRAQAAKAFCPRAPPSSAAHGGQVKLDTVK